MSFGTHEFVVLKSFWYSWNLLLNLERFWNHVKLHIKGHQLCYNDIVWVKMGRYQWWPSEVVHPTCIPANLECMPHGPGEFVTRFLGTNEYYWVNQRRCFLYKVSSFDSKLFFGESFIIGKSTVFGELSIFGKSTVFGESTIFGDSTKVVAFSFRKASKAYLILKFLRKN